MKTWQDCATKINKEKKSPDGKLLFSFGIGSKPLLKNRFESLIDYVMREQNNAPFRSGGDDNEPDPTEI